MKTLNEKINAAIEERDAAIIKLLESGATYQRTAEVAGCSISKVQYIAKTHGLLRRRTDSGKVDSNG